MDQPSSAEERRREAMEYAQEQMEIAQGRENVRKNRAKGGSQVDPFSALIVKPRGVACNYEITSDPVVSGLFSTRVPRDAGAGLASGIKSVTKGVAVGVASLVVCPVVGVSENGIKGFFKGVGAGVLAAVMLPLAGLGVAGYQVSRGVLNTPKAICKKASGKVWDKKHGEWKDNWYSLEEEAAQVLNCMGAHVVGFTKDGESDGDADHEASQPAYGDDGDKEKMTRKDFVNPATQTNTPTGAAKEKGEFFYSAECPGSEGTKATVDSAAFFRSNFQNNASGDNSRLVVDTELYDILGVSTSATQEEIRRRYYKLAKRYHPDRKGGDASGNMFKRLGEAYQVLGDEERRAKYDTMGKVACSDMPILDSDLFFMMLFGSEDFEPLVGKLRMALFIELELKCPGSTPSALDFEMCQTAREVAVAINLRNALRPYVCGDVDKWRVDIHEKAKALCKNSFSTQILEAIGWTYENYANQYLGKLDTFLGLKGRVAKVQEQSRSFTKGLKALKSIVKTAVAERSLLKSRRNGEDQRLMGEAYVGDVCESSLPEILEVMLNICLVDVQHTVRAACKRVLKDQSVDAHWRRKRAQGLAQMGKVFATVASQQFKYLQNAKAEGLYDAFVDPAQGQRQRAPFYQM